MKKRLLYSLLIIVIVAVVAVAHYVFQWNPFKPLRSGTVTVNNIERQFYYYVPQGISENPKLIFVLHGSTMTAREMIVVTGHQFNKLADEDKNVIIVYPQGYKRYWNDCRKVGTYETKKLNIDDVGFFEQMIYYFSAKYNIDKNEVFAAGYSNGGHMCFKLAKEKPELFKGFAVISADLPIETNNDCYESNKPVSILVMNGTTDPINPYNGGEMNLGDGLKRGSVMSTEQTIRYWTSLSECDTTLKTEYDFPDIDESDNSTAVKYDYKCTATNKEVVLIKIINGGHNIPNPTFSLWPKAVGNVNKDINAPKIIYDYFMSLK